MSSGDITVVMQHDTQLNTKRYHEKFGPGAKNGPRTAFAAKKVLGPVMANLVLPKFGPRTIYCRTILV